MSTPVGADAPLSRTVPVLAGQDTMIAGWSALR